MFPHWISCKALLAIGVITLCTLRAGQAEPIALEPGEIVLAPGETATATVTVPALAGDIAILKMSGWLQAKTLAGAAQVLKVTLNGIPLQQALGREKIIHLERGVDLTLYSERQGWLLFYAPDAKALLSRAGNAHFVSETFDPADLRLLLPDVSTGEWKFEFTNAAPENERFTIMVELAGLQVDFISQDEANTYRNE